MSQDTRDLRNAAFYIVTLLALAGGLVLGGVLSAKRVDASAAMQAIASVFDGDETQVPTRLSVSVERAREIRAALERPIPPLEPLPPITAKVAHGHIKSGKHAARPAQLPKAALDAMASAEIPASQTAQAPRASLPRVEMHRVY